MYNGYYIHKNIFITKNMKCFEIQYIIDLYNEYCLKPNVISILNNKNK